MTMEEIVKDVFLKIFSELNGSFDWKKTQTEYENWDSLTHLDLTSELEKKFNFQFEMDEIIAISSAEEALKIVKRKKNDNT